LDKHIQNNKEKNKQTVQQQKTEDRIISPVDIVLEAMVALYIEHRQRD
jgi:hypothetical protein